MACQCREAGIEADLDMRGKVGRANFSWAVILSTTIKEKEPAWVTKLSRASGQESSCWYAAWPVNVGRQESKLIWTCVGRSVAQTFLGQ